MHNRGVHAGVNYDGAILDRAGEPFVAGHIGEDLL